jgi:hypothetical protein
MHEREAVGDSGTDRTAVPGGWLYERLVVLHGRSSNSSGERPPSAAIGLCFVPDPTAPHVTGIYPEEPQRHYNAAADRWETR